MKKLLLSFLTIFGVFTMFAQTIVSTTPENRNVVLEEFTGIHCGYCPDGHKKANEFADANPGDVVLVNIHTGSFATPGPGEPDYRTSWATAIAGQSGLTGYPAGTINRHLFPGMQQGSGTAMSRGDWSTAGGEVLLESSYLNIGANAVIDVDASTMTINVEVYYTGTSPETSNWLNIALVQNNIEGPQSGSAGNPTAVLPNGNYLHQHMFRDAVTGQWGEEITTTTTGSLYANSYTYPIPTDVNGVSINLGQLELAIFVAETHQEIVTGINIEPTLTNFTSVNDANVFGVTFPTVPCDGTEISPTFTIQNLGSAPLTSVTIEYEINGGTIETLNWVGTIESFYSETITLAPATFVMQAVNVVTITATTTNGTTDDNLSNNVLTGEFDETPQAYSTIHFVLVTDNYGSETSWEFVDAAGNVYAEGSGYSDGSTQEVENMDIALPALGCYEFIIYDTYGDGIDAGYGVGSFTITDSEGNDVLDGGVFGDQDNKPFKVTTMTIGIESSDFAAGVNIVPNPASDMAFIELSLLTSQDVMFKLYNSQGQLVRSANEFVGSDFHRASFDVSSVQSGVYFLSIESENSTYTQKLIIE